MIAKKVVAAGNALNVFQLSPDFIVGAKKVQAARYSAELIRVAIEMPGNLLVTVC